MVLLLSCSGAVSATRRTWDLQGCKSVESRALSRGSPRAGLPYLRWGKNPLRVLSLCFGGCLPRRQRP